jgi:hypothetical protein
MSMSLFLLLPLDAPLKTEHLNEAAIKLEVPIVFNSDIDLGNHSGFLPALVNGTRAGVEILKLSFAEVSYVLPPNKDITSTETLVIQFRLGVDSNETLIALYTALLYLSCFNGIAFDSMSNQYFTTEQLQQNIDTILKPA